MSQTPAVPAPPRPLATWAIVLVSAAALALTGEVSSLALGLYAIAVIASLRLRTQPRPWQRSAALLNGLLFGVIGLSVLQWLQGALALVALAHFALLAQGLQLLDGRTRRSDFLLVALALFVIILAANLTDSILFPPLLLAFLVASVWTLIVHTLWTEAIQAGEVWSAQRAVAPRLLRTTLGASAAAVALGLALFLFLPRLHSGALVAGNGLGGPAAGFSDRVTLGDLGRIRRDPSVAIRVETLRGESPDTEHAYYRGLAFDHFDGRLWSVTPNARVALPGASDLGVRVGRALREPDLVQRLLREPVASGVLFGAGRPVQIEGSLGRVERDPNGGLYAPESASDRVQYVIESDARAADAPTLRADRAALPERGGERFLALPPFSPAVGALAAELVAGAETDFDRARAIERWLRQNGRYSDTPPPDRNDDPRSPIEPFLLERTEGHCEYFASAMVVLLRSLGLPARLVNGFAGGRVNEIGDFVELSRADAHAWVELHFEGAGWVGFDPTPPDLRMRALPASWLARVRDVAGAAEHWWYQHVVEFDRSRQLRALRSGWLAWQRWREGRPVAAPPPAPGERREGWRGISLRPYLGPALLVAVALALVAQALRLLWRARRARGLPLAYAEALQLLARERGLVRGPTTAARDFARRAARSVPPAAAAAFWTLTEEYLAERFGGRKPATPRRALRALRDSLHA